MGGLLKAVHNDDDDDDDDVCTSVICSDVPACDCALVRRSVATGVSKLRDGKSVFVESVDVTLRHAPTQNGRSDRSSTYST